MTGDHETYWDIAEATLGDGTRWREILDANPGLGHIDLVPAGTTLIIPGDPHAVTVVKGDNLWKLAAHELRDAHGTKPTNAEIVPYWRDLIETNTDRLISHDPDLIYRGETIELPAIDSPVPLDERNAQPETAKEQPPAEPAPTSTIPPAPPTTAPAPAAESLARDTEASIATEDPPADDYEPFDLPWIEGLALTGVASASLLAAWHAQRRRRIRAHRPGDPIPTLAEADRDLISQLRSIAEPERHAAIDAALRLLAAVTPEDEAIPGVTIARVGRYAVELLLDNPQTQTPERFIRLDQHTIVINPGIPDEEIAEAIEGRCNPSPGMVVVGADSVGSLLVDLERVAALAIEAETPAEADSVVTALVTELAAQPWADGVTVHVLGIPSTIDPESRIVEHTDPDELIAAAEAHLQSQTDEVVTDGTHTIRAHTNKQASLLIAVLGSGHRAAAKVLADAARERGSALAVVSAEALPNSSWRLVMVDGKATLEPAGITVENRQFLPNAIDPEASERLIETFGTPTPSPADADSAVSEDDTETETDTETQHEEEADAEAETDAEVGNNSVIEMAGEIDGAADEDGLSDEAEVQPVPIAEADLRSLPVDLVWPAGSGEIVVNGRTAETVSSQFSGFDQLVLVTEPVGEPLAASLTVSEKINAILERKPIELVLLDGPPRLEGVCWDPKKAPRADEIVAFIMLNGPSTLRQVALALWPDHPRPDKTASQQISRARALLGNDAAGRPRLSVGNRATPYVVHDVGCDWHRFQQLSALSTDVSGQSDALMFLTAAMSVVRSAPFEGARSNSFHWAADGCFDSRLRIEVDAAIAHLERLTPNARR